MADEERESALKNLNAYLCELAGNDPTLPATRVDPNKEWAFRLYPGDPVHRCVTVVRFRGDEDDLRTKYTLVEGPPGCYGVVHCYPKDQWTEAEARESFGKREAEKAKRVATRQDRMAKPW